MKLRYGWLAAVASLGCDAEGIGALLDALEHVGPHEHTPPSNGAMTRVVTKFEDSQDGACDADCSLREAVEVASASGAQELITLGAGFYVLSIPARTEGENDTVEEDYNTIGDLDLKGNIRIVGASAERTFIHAARSRDRVLEVLESAVVRLEDLTVSGGSISSEGGGIANHGQLTLERVRVTHNYASGWATGSGGGILNQGQLEIRDSVIAHNGALGGDSNLGQGGGILNYGSLRIENSLLVSNAANNGDSDIGGGLANYGSATIRSSTLLENGALYGSGIANLSGGDLTVVNSTLSGNGLHNGQPFRVAAGPVQLFQVTLTGGSQSGLVNYGEVTAANSIIAGNGYDDDWETQFNCQNADEGQLISLGGNRIGSDGNCDPTGPGDALVDDSSVIGPLLLPLANNGGPTETHALAPGAVNSGRPEICLSDIVGGVDQRGLPRADVETCDSGAHAGAAENVFEVTRQDDAFDAVCDGDCSLRDAIAEANRYPGPAVIVATPATYRLTIRPTAEPGAAGDEAGSSHGDLDVTGDVTFTVKAADARTRVEIVGQHDDRVFDIHPGSRTTFRRWNVSGGRTAEAGGGIRNRGHLQLEWAVVTDNHSGSDGGGIFNAASLWLRSVTLSGNSAEGAGGGLFNDEQADLITSVVGLRTNTAATGGALHNRGMALHRILTPSANQSGDGQDISSTSTAVAWTTR